MALAIFALMAPMLQASDDVPESVRSVLDQWLQQQWADADVSWTVEDASRLDVLQGASRIVVRGAEKPRGRTVLNLEAYLGEEVLRRVPVRITVTPVAWVPVATRQLDREQVVRKGDYRWEQRDVSTVRGEWPHRTEDLSDGIYWARRRIQLGDVLVWRDVERRPEVVRGDRVLMVSSQGGVNITIEGVAMQNGAKGETVRVRNPRFGSIVRAEVADVAVVNVLGVEHQKRGRRR